MPNPLDNLLVIDCSRLLPGPLCSLFLADLGATVVKVEPPEGGDYARNLPPLLGESSGLFELLNRNKKSIALDLKNEKDRQLFFQLVEKADVLLESFRPGVMEKLGCSYEQLKPKNERLIYCSLSGYGQTGSMAQKAGHDLNFISQMGYFSTTEPTLPLAQVADVGGSFLALSHILSALYQREKTNQGTFCDVSLAEATLPFLTFSWAEWISHSANKQPKENLLLGDIPSYSLYPCKDGKFMAVAALELKFWAQFVTALGLEDLIVNAYDRGDEALVAKKQIEEKLVQKTQTEWIEFFASLDCCVSPVLSMDELPESPLAKERELLLPFQHSNQEIYYLPRSVFRFQGCPPLLPTRAPKLDQDRHFVLQLLQHSS